MTIRVSPRMAHWGIRLIALSVAFGLVGFSQPAVEAGCQIYCVQGDNGCEADEHYAYETWMGTRDGDPHFSCVQASCHDKHLICPQLPAEELKALEGAALASDRSKVGAILAEYPSLTVNIERSALQQSDCGGKVVAHIPVASTLISELLAVGQR